MWSINRYWYIFTDPLFYEPFEYFQSDDDSFLSAVKDALPADWSIRRSDIWQNCNPGITNLPAQGWKIHISATIGDAGNVLKSVVPILVRECVPFKFALDPMILRMLLSKQWPRGSAGKFITIYPQGSDQFLSLLDALDSATKEYAGPYILSDRRYKSSKCVYYRYGSFAKRTSLRVNGERTPYILSPDGEQVPDARNAWCVIPKWIQDPLAPTQETPSGQRLLKGGRYRIESALHFSNTGGIYVATDTQTDEKVVIKEARPRVAPDGVGVDAIVSLRKEHRILATIEPARIAPRVIDFFEEWEHCFLVEEYVGGSELRHYAASRAFTRFTDPTPDDIRKSLEAFRNVFLSLTRVLAVLHEYGIAFRDLSPTNVLITPSGEVRLVDFEAACERGVDPVGRTFTFGFAAADHFADGFARFESDYFSLGALMLLFLVPVHSMIALDREAMKRFAASVTKDYGLPHGVRGILLGLLNAKPEERPSLAEVREGLGDTEVQPLCINERSEFDPGEIRDLLDQKIRYILSTAVYTRSDRLFPGDPKIFATNPLSLAYGACGVAYAIKRITGELPLPISEWIFRQEVTPGIYPPGMYIGMAGIAWTLLELGYQEKGEEILLASRNHPLLFESADVFYGASGWGMANLKFFLELKKQIYLDRAVEAGEWILQSRFETERGYHWGPLDKLWLGFAHGSSGISLFLLYLYLATGEEKFLRVGEQALRFDLSQAVPFERGISWPTHEGPGASVVPYWRYGSAGVGTALLRYAQISEDNGFRPTLEHIFADTARKYTIFPGKFFGLAGLGDFLLDMADFEGDDSRYLEAVHRVVAGIRLFQVGGVGYGPAFPGYELWKVSCDYGSGGAGIALLLHRVLTRGGPDFMLDELLERNPVRQDLATTAVRSGGPLLV